MAPPKAKSSPKAPSKAEAADAPEPRPSEAGTAEPAEPQAAKRPEARRLKVIDNPTITEQFANQVLDVLLVNGNTVSMTFGAKRNVRDAILGNRETVVAVNSRLTVDVQTAETLRNALNKVLLMAKQPSGGMN